MKSHHRRLSQIEVKMTPEQTVLLWLRTAQQNGSLRDGFQRSFSQRATIAKGVLKGVRNAMRFQDETTIGEAVQQALREADQLYLLAIAVNYAVVESSDPREREYVLLMKYIRAVLLGDPPRDCVENLRSELLGFHLRVSVLASARTVVKEEYFGGQEVLFTDSSTKLGEQLEMATELAEFFNHVADYTNAPRLDLEDLSTSVQSEASQQIDTWVWLSRLQMLATFGDESSLHAAFKGFIGRK